MPRRLSLLVSAVALSLLAVFAAPANATTTTPMNCPAVAIGENAQHTGYTCSTLSPILWQRWAKPLNGYPSEPLIAAGRVFVTSTRPGVYGGWLYALSEKTGKTLWGPIPLSGIYSWFPLAYDNSRVFVNDFDGTVRAFDATTGRLLWSKVTDYFSGQPTAIGGRIYLQRQQFGVRP